MSEPEPSDLELVRRIRVGDAAHFRTLLERHAGAARARIQAGLPREMRRKVDPEDVLQEAFLVATQRLNTFEGRHEGSFGAWLAQIVQFKTSEIVRHHMDARKRSAGRERTRGARPDTANFVGCQPTPSQAAIARELAALATRAADALSPDYRRILELVDLEGRSLQEAAAEMGRGYEATKKLHARALARLRTLMGP